jgi:diguanylate cyclase (GGDEF)-like protein
MPPQERRLISVPAVSRRSWSGMVTSEALRRRVYLWATLMGSVVLTVTWFIQGDRPHPDPYVLFANPVLLLQCVWIAWWLLRGKALIVAERVVFMVNVFAILAQVFLATVTGGHELLGVASSAYWTLVAISILSFLILSNRQALLFTATFFALGVILPWSALFFRGDALTDYSELGRVQLVCGVVLVLLSVLAWYREGFTEERGQRLSLEHLAHTDPLTGVPNRRALYREIEGLLEGTRRGAEGLGMGGCLILLDVDHFKRVNDTFGHNVGDEVLVRLAALIRTDLRDGDTVGRWGGEEFLITLPGLPLELGEQVAERLRGHLERQMPSHGPGVTASFGVTSCTPADDLQSCTARADRALYVAKTEGRNRVVGLQPDGVFGDDVKAEPSALNTLPVSG